MFFAFAALLTLAAAAWSYTAPAFARIATPAPGRRPGRRNGQQLDPRGSCPDHRPEVN